MFYDITLKRIDFGKTKSYNKRNKNFRRKSC